MRANLFEAATPADGPALLRMMEDLPAKGNIELLYTRRPDPYASYHGEGGDVSLGVIRGADGTPDFVESLIMRPMYLGGAPHEVGYLSGVRKRTGAALRGNWLRMLIEYERPRCERLFLSVLDGNEDVLSLFLKKRPYVPELRQVCDYTTYMVSPRALGKWAGKQDAAGYTFAHASADDLPEIYTFLRKYGQRYDFFPTVTDLEAQFTGLRLSDCFLVRDSGGIAAFGALWDQTAYKQYIVARYRGPMRLARLASPLLRAAGYVPIPPPGTVLKLATLTLLAAREDALAPMAALLSGLAEQAAERGVAILVAGIPKGNWQDALFQNVRHLQFGSKIYYAQAEPLPWLPAGNGHAVHLECGLL